MVKKYSVQTDCCSEMPSTAMSSMVSSFVSIKKARTCFKEKDLKVHESCKEPKPFSEIPLVCAKPLSSNGKEETTQEKLEKLKRFREKRQGEKLKEQQQHTADVQLCLQEKEMIDNIRKYNPLFHEEEIMGAAREPLIGHEVSKEYRTKMIDWMIEVCVSFKFSNRTYFLAVAILDRYFIASHQYGVVLQNKDIHSLGVTALYMASKYEDVFPLHSKIVAEKIAHFAISAEQIVKKEREILQMFSFQLDFVTHYDFYQTYCDKLSKQLRIDLPGEVPEHLL